MAEVTPEILAKALGRSELPDTVATQLDELIEHAKAIVSGYLGRPLAVIQASESFEMRGRDRRIHLANTPIGSVTQIDVDGSILDQDFMRIGANYIDLERRPAPLGASTETVTISYAGGIDLTATGWTEAGRCANTINAVILDFSHRLARKMLDDRHDLESLRIEGYTATFADAGDSGLLERERRRLVPHKRIRGPGVS